MKSIQKVFSIILIIIVCSCGKDDGINQLGNLDGTHDISEIVTRSNQNPIYNKPIYSKNELIIQYKPGVSMAAKAALRAFHQVIDYEVCQQCPDGRIEKWVFDMNIQIEPKKHTIIIIGVTTDIVEVDYNFELVSEIEGIEVGTGEDKSYEPLIASGNPGLTIAILDTGFDPFFPFWYEDEEPIPLLYDASETAMYGESSGWDFIDSDPNPFDDNPGKHGSVIAYELQNILSEAEVEFQILPAKIFNQDGNTSYFHVVCGANYVLPIADIVGMSFGWFGDAYGEFESTILKNLIEEYNDVIIVTSAGNGNGDDDYEGDDNDVDTHYPSCYDLENIIAVGATNGDGTEPALWSNYGANSVDFWAVGMDIPFYDYDYEEIPLGVQGTSFAAPQIAAQAAIHLSSGDDLTPENVIDSIDLYGTLAPFGLMVKYNKYYPTMIY